MLKNRPLVSAEIEIDQVCWMRVIPDRHQLILSIATLGNMIYQASPNSLSLSL
jgi:hypothetical protein